MGGSNTIIKYKNNNDNVVNYVNTIIIIHIISCNKRRYA
jgi:hypothetical protein